MNLRHKETNGVITARKVSILLFGFFIAMVGTAVCVVVLLRYFYPPDSHSPDFDVKIFSLGVMILFVGLALIYTGNPIHVFKLVNAQRPGGRRFTDPPLETAPKEVPRDKWDPIPPRKGRDD